MIPFGGIAPLFTRNCAKRRCPARCLAALIGPQQTPAAANESVRWLRSSSSGPPPLTPSAPTEDARIVASSYDPYNRYRTWSLTQDVWAELQDENKRTRKAIDVKLYEQILDEVCQAFSTIPPAVPEVGPTGQYCYSFGPSPEAEGEQDRMLYSRRRYASPSKTETVLNLSIKEYQKIQNMSLSVDEMLVACLQDDSERSSSSRLLIRHIEQGLEEQPTIHKAKNSRTDNCDSFRIASVEWGPIQVNGHHSLYYVTEDSLGRPSTVWVCTVDPGSLQTSPSHRLVHFEDQAIMVDIQRTKGCQYVAIQATTKTDNEIYLHRKVSDAPLLVRPCEDGILYHVDVGTDNDVYLLASKTDSSPQDSVDSTSPLGLELSLFETRIESLPLKGNEFGTLMSGAQQGYAVEDIDIFKDFVALYERSTEDGRQRIRVQGRHKPSSKDTIVPFTDPDAACCVVSPGGNMNYHASSIRFCVESPAKPGNAFCFDVSTGEVSRISSPDDTPGQGTNYIHERVMVASQDGTQVPLSLVYRKDPKVGTRPAVLFGYGSYGEPMNLSFDPAFKPLFDRGFVLAYAHTRGGGDLGRGWYQRGRLYQKEKAIEDYIACAKALSGELGITKPESLTAEAFSAGGVVVGAAVNRCPELFGSVVLTNAFLDVQQTMQNAGLLLTTHEFGEFGNPRGDPKAATAIAVYCPVSNATAKTNNPRFLIIGAFDDKNVPFWNGFIYASKLRIKNSSRNQVYVHIATHGGHHFRGNRLDIAALKTTFILGNRAEFLGMLMNPYVMWGDDAT